MFRSGSVPLGPPAAAVLVILAGAAAAPDGALAAPVRVDAVVETADAVFFQPRAFPNVVWFFPRSEIRLFPFEPKIPGLNLWRAAVELVDVDISNLAALRPDWANKSPVPYIVRPPTECQLLEQPEMESVFLEISAELRDVSAAMDVPVCQFSFLLPSVIPDELAARLESLRTSGTLVTRNLPVELEMQKRVSWSVVHAAVTAALSEDGGEEDGGDEDGGDEDGGDEDGPADPLAPRSAIDPAHLTPDQVRAAIESALASDALDEVESAMTAAERASFIDRARRLLFVPAGSDGTFAFVPRPPTGEIVYHVDRIVRSM